MVVVVGPVQCAVLKTSSMFCFACLLSTQPNATRLGLLVHDVTSRQQPSDSSEITVPTAHSAAVYHMPSVQW